MLCICTFDTSLGPRFPCLSHNTKYIYIYILFMPDLLSPAPRVRVTRPAASSARSDAL